MRKGLIGAVLTRSVGPGQVVPGALWCADNECFSRGDEFNLDRYLAWLDKQDRSTCLFATAPDVLCDAAGTLARSAPVLPVLRAMGYRAALVAQNGLEHLDVPWETFDALFIGGDTAWKLSAAAHDLILQAKARGKWVHMGRVNGGSRFRRADVMGCDSVDGTFLAFGPDKNLPRLLAWDDTPALSEMPARDSETPSAAALDRLVDVMAASIYGWDWRFTDHSRISSVRMIEENCRTRLVAVLPALADELQRENRRIGYAIGAVDWLRSLAAPADEPKL